MLKKMTVFSLLLLLVCFLVGIVLIPITVRDVIKNKDSLIGTFVNSSEIVTLSSSEHPALLLDIAHSNLVIEPSTDENIYMKTEGVFGNQFELVTSPSTFEEKPVTKLSLFKEDLFFDQNTPSYLFSKAIHNESNVTVILRVPKNVSIFTTGSETKIYYACSNGVEFLNVDRYKDAVARKNQRYDYYENYEYNTEVRSDNPVFLSYIDLRNQFENELHSATERYYSVGVADEEQLQTLLLDITTLYRRRLDTLLQLTDAVNMENELAVLTEQRLDDFLELRKQAETISVLFASGSNEYDSSSVNDAVQSAYMAQSAFERMLVEFLDTDALLGQAGEYAASAPELAVQEDTTVETASAAPAVPEAPAAPVAPEAPAAPAAPAAAAAESATASKLIVLSSKLMSKL